MVSGTRLVYSGSSGFCMLGDGASMDLLQHVLQTLYQIGICGIWRPSQHRAHCPAEGPLPSGSVIVMRGCAWSTTVSEWVVCDR